MRCRDARRLWQWHLSYVTLSKKDDKCSEVHHECIVAFGFFILSYEIMSPSPQAVPVRAWSCQASRRFDRCRRPAASQPGTSDALQPTWTVTWSSSEAGEKHEKTGKQSPLDTQRHSEGCAELLYMKVVFLVEAWAVIQGIKCALHILS